MNSKKIKIGIFSKELSNLRTFEYRIFNEIFNDENLELSVLFFDGRKKSKPSLIDKLISLVKSKKRFPKFYLKFRKKNMNTLNYTKQ